LSPRAAALLAVWIALPTGCVTRPVLEPLPCVRIAEVPALEAELRALRELDRARVEQDLPPLSWETRVYVVRADADCAGNRVLRGEPIEPTLSWWERSWIGRLLRYLGA